MVGITAVPQGHEVPKYQITEENVRAFNHGHAALRKPSLYLEKNSQQYFRRKVLMLKLQ